jgi:tRNA(adenine34) deaminase
VSVNPEDFSASDAVWMQQALTEARKAALLGEVPVGAVLVQGDRCLASAHNLSIAGHDPTGHAEIRALRAAAGTVGNYRLTGATLYVTLEPCPMCVGAMIHARISRLVYAADDPRTGAVRSAIPLLTHPSHNHRIAFSAGLCADEAGQILRDFFRERRGTRKESHSAGDPVATDEFVGGHGKNGC